MLSYHYLLPPVHVGLKKGKCVPKTDKHLTAIKALKGNLDPSSLLNTDRVKLKEKENTQIGLICTI